MNNFNVHFNPWAGGFFGAPSRVGPGLGSPFFQPPFGFGAGLARGWMQHASHSMNHGWGHRGGWGGCESSNWRAHGAHGGCGPTVPREGRWNADKGSYTVGRSGQLAVQVGQSDAAFNNNMQYRVNGGAWQSLGSSKDTGDKTFIHAPPGSDVQFRIQTPEGNTFRAGTTRNADGLDHGKVTRTGNGYRLGFEDLRGIGDADFNDAVLNLSDPGHRH